jgi:hypothetical protein
MEMHHLWRDRRSGDPGEPVEVKEFIILLPLKIPGAKTHRGLTSILLLLHQNPAEKRHPCK